MIEFWSKQFLIKHNTKLQQILAILQINISLIFLQFMTGKNIDENF
jgi:hypothetical protein